MSTPATDSGPTIPGWGIPGCSCPPNAPWTVQSCGHCTRPSNERYDALDRCADHPACAAAAEAWADWFAGLKTLDVRPFLLRVARVSPPSWLRYQPIDTLGHKGRRYEIRTRQVVCDWRSTRRDVDPFYMDGGCLGWAIYYAEPGADADDQRYAGFVKGEYWERREHTGAAVRLVRADLRTWHT